MSMGLTHCEEVLLINSFWQIQRNDYVNGVFVYLNRSQTPQLGSEVSQVALVPVIFVSRMLEQLLFLFVEICIL